MPPKTMPPKRVMGVNSRGGATGTGAAAKAARLRSKTAMTSGEPPCTGTSSPARSTKTAPALSMISTAERSIALGFSAKARVMAGQSAAAPAASSLPESNSVLPCGAARNVRAASVMSSSPMKLLCKR